MTTEQSVQTSVTGKRWLRKFVIFALVLLGFGSWALYDAVWKYPDRGRRHAEWAEWQYLNVLNKEAQDRRDPGILTREAPVADPVAELERLSAAGAASSRASEAARWEWLTALSRVGDLVPENTSFQTTSPRQRRDELDTKWSTASAPSPLASWDIPSQWLMMVAGYGLGGWMVLLILRVMSTKYRWEAATKTLILPGGARISPSDLSEVDKRKWDKFIVFLNIKPEVAKVGGQSVRVDTYRHDLVEGWILEMEREAFGSEETPAAGESPKGESDGGASESQPEQQNEEATRP